MEKSLEENIVKLVIELLILLKNCTEWGSNPRRHNLTRLKRVAFTTRPSVLTIYGLVLLVPFSLERYRFQLKNCCMEL